MRKTIFIAAAIAAGFAVSPAFADDAAPAPAGGEPAAKPMVHHHVHHVVHHHVHHVVHHHVMHKAKPAPAPDQKTM
jgi:hypothetical protein